MKDTYGKRTYICGCGLPQEDFVWESELRSYKFSCTCGKKIGYEHIKTKPVVEMAAIRTPTKNR